MGSGSSKKKVTPIKNLFKSRITDVEEENPNDDFDPLVGLAEIEPRSFVDCVELLTDIVQNIKYHAAQAMRKAEQVGSSSDNFVHMDTDEIAVINLYTKPTLFFQILNRRLRSKGREDLEPFLPILLLLCNALDKMPGYEGTVYRGVKKDISDRYKKGETVVWWGFSSCTKRVKTLQNTKFLGKMGKRTLFNIDIEHGFKIKYLSLFKEEEEILLPPGVHLKVQSIFDAGHGLKIIQLKQVQSENETPEFDYNFEYGYSGQDWDEEGEGDDEGEEEERDEEDEMYTVNDYYEEDSGITMESVLDFWSKLAKGEKPEQEDQDGGEHLPIDDEYTQEHLEAEENCS